MKTKQKNFYKIIHKPTGLFKLGGLNSDFGKIGKIWRGPTIKAHIQQFLYYFKREQYLKREQIDTSSTVQKGWDRFGSWYSKDNIFKVEDCDVVEYELVEVNRQPLTDFLKNEINKPL
jgi:hypothetical protein